MRASTTSLACQAAVLGVLGNFASPVWALDEIRLTDSHTASRVAPSANTGQQSMVFDIAVQPLATALYQYGEVSRQPALFDADMIASRKASAVRGRYTPEQALFQLLKGSGLLAEKLSSAHGETFVLKEINKGATNSISSLPQFLNEGRYSGLVQSRIWQALCADPRTRPGDYSSLFRFQLDATGRVIEPRLLGSTGNVQRDDLLLIALHGVRMDSTPPPVVMQQPLTMLLVPGHQIGQGCDQQTGAH